MKVWVVIEEYNDGGAGGDFLMEIFSNEEGAKRFKQEQGLWGEYMTIKEWEVKE